MKQPFISPYISTVAMLSEQMNLLNPGRKAMFLSMSAALALTAPKKGIMNTEKIINDIKEAKAGGKLIPKICNVFIANQ